MSDRIRNDEVELFRALEVTEAEDLAHRMDGGSYLIWISMLSGMHPC